MKKTIFSVNKYIDSEGRTIEEWIPLTGSEPKKYVVYLQFVDPKTMSSRDIPVNIKDAINPGDAFNKHDATVQGVHDKMAAEMSKAKIKIASAGDIPKLVVP